MLKDKKKKDKKRKDKFVLNDSQKLVKPGQILILLVGPHRGKRVVFLKWLEKSRLMLVTGPHRINNCPLRRVARPFTIATQTNIDLGPDFKLPDRFIDAYFQGPDKKQRKKIKRTQESDLFAGGKEDYVLSEERRKDQKEVDAAVLDAIRKHPESAMVKAYLSARFGLGKGDRPHKMTF